MKNEQIEFLFTQLLYDFEVNRSNLDHFTKFVIARVNYKIKDLGNEATDLKNYLDSDYRDPTLNVTDVIHGITLGTLSKLKSGFQSHEETFKRMIINYSFSILESVFSQSMKIYYTIKPEKLPPNIDSLTLDQRIEKKVLSFMYKKINSQLNSLQQNQKINFYEKWTQDEVDKLIEFKATRDILIHNSGKISQKYLTEISNSTFELNSNRDISWEYIEEGKRLISDFVHDLTWEMVEILKS